MKRAMYILLPGVLLFACGEASTGASMSEEEVDIEASDTMVAQEILDDSLEDAEEVLEEVDCQGELEVYIMDPDGPTNIRKSPGGDVVLEGR